MGEGHLDQALEWTDSLDLACRVPIDPERPEAAAAAMMVRWAVAARLGFAATAGTPVRTPGRGEG